MSARGWGHIPELRAQSEQRLHSCPPPTPPQATCTLLPGHPAWTTWASSRTCVSSVAVCCTSERGWGPGGTWGADTGAMWALTWLCLGSGAYSLTLQDLAVRALGLRALQEISSGMVLIHHNPQLCFLQKVPWDSIFRHPRQHLFQTHNKAPEQCGEDNPSPSAHGPQGRAVGWG